MEEYYNELKEVFDLRNSDKFAVEEIENKMNENLNRGFEINNQVFAMDKESIEYGVLMKEKEGLEKENEELKTKKEEIENKFFKRMASIKNRLESNIKEKEKELEKNENEKEKLVDEIVTATMLLSKNQTGALISIEQGHSLSDYIKTGTPLNSNVTAELLTSIFVTTTPLHDGAVIIEGEKILSAGVLLPLTEDPKLSWRYGTRHRAAIGITEISDCACIVVSEETGDVSIATAGSLKKYEDLGALKADLERILGYAKKEDDKKQYIFKFENILPSKYQ